MQAVQIDISEVLLGTSAGGVNRIEGFIACRLAVYRQPGFVDAVERILVLQEPEIRARNNLTDAEWSAIAAPTLVLWTSHDPTAPADIGRRIAGLIAGARFELMHDCGHWPQFEDPATFNRVHLEFLRGVR